MDLRPPARLQICRRKRKSAMSERRQIDKRTVLVIQFHPTGGLLAKHISVRAQLSGSTELALRLTNQFKSVLMDLLGFQVLLEVGAKL